MWIIVISGSRRQCWGIFDIRWLPHEVYTCPCLLACWILWINWMSGHRFPRSSHPCQIFQATLPLWNVLSRDMERESDFSWRNMAPIQVHFTCILLGFGWGRIMLACAIWKIKSFLEGVNSLLSNPHKSRSSMIWNPHKSRIYVARFMIVYSLNSHILILYKEVL